MMRPTRSLPSQVFVVLAIVALASVALAPRGMLRAAVAEDLDIPTSRVDASPTIDGDKPAVWLPGVRAVASREEQDPHEALLDALMTEPGAGHAATTILSHSEAVDTTVQPPPPPAPPEENGDRAPPSLI